jgi:hypothetical protein
MAQKLWQNDVESLMDEEGFNNFSAYMTFLIKLRRESLHQRRMEVARLENKPHAASAAALNEAPKDKAG